MIKILTLLLLVAIAATQTPPFWGGNKQYKVNVNMTYNKPVMNWTFDYYYDATIKAERYEHKAPQADEMCLFANPPFGINDSCVVIFSDDGWSYVQYPQHNWCCKCEDKFHYINYEWLQSGSTYEGIENVNNYTVQHWTKKGMELNHYYNALDGLPVRFFELKSGVPKSWDFNLNTYVKGAVDKSLFAAPCSNLCSGTCKYFREFLNKIEDSNMHASTE